MKAWIVDGKTGIKGMQQVDFEEPIPRSGEVVLAVGLAALNPADAYLAEGQYPARPSFPHILGRDAVGTVAAAGPDVRWPVVGERVIVLRSEVGVNRPGTFAERVAVPAVSLAPVPGGWADEQAAGAALVYITAWQALSQWDAFAGLAGTSATPGVVLVTGASGGVGVASVQLGKGLGHTVVALSRSAGKADKLRKLGADLTFNPQEKTWSKACRAALGAKRVDLAIDNIGGAGLAEVIDCLAMNGRVSVVGRLAGPVPSFNTASLFFRRLKMGGVAIATYSDDEMRAVWQRVVAELARTGARPLVDHVFGFAELPAAFARLAEGPMGKVLVKVA